MTAQEVRQFRNASKKLVIAEERSKLLEELRKKKICFGEEEVFAQKSLLKLKSLGANKGVTKSQHDELIMVSLKYKIRDNNQDCVRTRRKRNWLRGRLESVLGAKSVEMKRIVSEVN